jgi:hypothetical protein
MKPKAFFLFLCTVFVAGDIFCQNNGEKAPHLLLTSFNNNPGKNLFSLSHSSDYMQSVQTYLPSNFYVTGLGFFCKQEIKLEKITKVPFRFRLGSVEECDHMEGKDRKYF